MFAKVSLFLNLVWQISSQISSQIEFHKINFKNWTQKLKKSL